MATGTLNHPQSQTAKPSRCVSARRALTSLNDTEKPQLGPLPTLMGLGPNYGEDAGLQINHVSWVDLGPMLLSWMDLGPTLVPWLDLGPTFVSWMDLGPMLVYWMAPLQVHCSWSPSPFAPD